MKKEIIIIAAVAKNGVIGKGNTLPWRLPKDMRIFAEKTINHTVIMGRKTYESIPVKFRPLPDRRNIVISSQDIKIDGVEVYKDLQTAIDAVDFGLIFICGGARVYNEALPIADFLYLSEVQAEIEGDVFFPEFDKTTYFEVSRVKHEADEKNAHAFDFVVYSK